MDTVTIGQYFGDDSHLMEVPHKPLNPTGTRIATWLVHTYKSDGRHEMWLIASSDPRVRQLRGKSDVALQVMPTDETWIHIASVLVEHGEVVHVHADESTPATPAKGTVEIETFK